MSFNLYRLAYNYRLPIIVDNLRLGRRISNNVIEQCGYSDDSIKYITVRMAEKLPKDSIVLLDAIMSADDYRKLKDKCLIGFHNIDIENEQNMLEKGKE